jgi:hypothetical protein
MIPKERGKLIAAIAEFYDVSQLDAIVKQALNHELEYYASGETRPIIFGKLLTELERADEDLVNFLALLRSLTSFPQVRRAINAYLGLPPDPDPYDALKPLDEPFVNRQNSRDKLRNLFRSANRRALAIRGPRASGKSHSHWLIEHVARSEGIEPVFVQLRGVALDEILAQIINDLRLPVQEFRDRQAQFTTQAKGFISAFRGWTKTLPATSRWCLLFDNHDDETVTSEARDFVDDLLSEAADFRMPPIFVVALGHRAATRPGAATANRVVADDIVQMTQPDVDRFLLALAAQAGLALSPARSGTLTEAIFKGLVPPLDHEGMTTLTGRLFEKIIEIGIV